MVSRRQALTFARQYRTCPPPRVARDKTQANEIKKHLAICPYCATAGATAAVWEKLGHAIAALGSGQKQRTTRVQPGDIRPVRPEKAVWRDSLYFSPPWVMVVAPLGPTAFRVAQTFHDNTLAGPGDLVLPLSLTRNTEGFIEAWNTYPLLAEDLGPLIWRPRPVDRNAILAYCNDPSRLPAWGTVPAPLIEHDPRIYFRQLETEVAFTFAAPAVDALLTQMEDAAPQMIYPRLSDLKAVLKQLWPGAKIQGKPANAAEVLAVLRLPEEHYAMAAADTAAQRLPVNLVAVDKGKLAGLAGTFASIHLQSKKAGQWTVSGRLSTLPESAANGRLLCFWQEKDGRLTPPATLTWEPCGVFVIRFAPPPGQEGSLKLVLVYESDLPSDRR